MSSKSSLETRPLDTPMLSCHAPKWLTLSLDANVSEERVRGSSVSVCATATVVSVSSV